MTETAKQEKAMQGKKKKGTTKQKNALDQTELKFSTWFFPKRNIQKAMHV
jgi:hypothetical protein